MCAPRRCVDACRSIPRHEEFELRGEREGATQGFVARREPPAERRYQARHDGGRRSQDRGPRQASGEAQPNRGSPRRCALGRHRCAARRWGGQRRAGAFPRRPLRRCGRVRGAGPRRVGTNEALRDRGNDCRCDAKRPRPAPLSRPVDQRRAQGDFSPGWYSPSRCARTSCSVRRLGRSFCSTNIGDWSA